MTATMINHAEARPRGPQPGDDAARATFRLLPGRVVAYAWLLAAVPIGLLQVVHSDLHEHIELPPVLHWVRDTSLAVPFGALAVVLAAVLVARLRPTQTGQRAALTTIALWAVLAALLFAVLSIPGNQLHGFLFGAEEEAGVSLLDDLAVDAVYALEGALLVVAPLALLAGVPWRGAWRATVPTPQPAQSSGPSQVAPAGPSASHDDQAITHDGGDR